MVQEKEVGVSSILSALYLLPVFYSFENHLKNLKISISIISFVDNSLFISQNKSILYSNTNLFCCYNIISSLLTKYSLVVEHRKTDIFHFSRSHSLFNPPSLDLSPLEGLILLVIYKSTCPENYISVIMPPLNHTSLPSTVATFLIIRLMAVLQPSGYSVFHDRDTPIQLSLP